MKLLIAFSTLVFFFLGGPVSATETEDSRLRVELVVTGDDALTRDFANHVETALSKSKHFLYPSNGEHDLYLHIIGNLYWQDTDRGTNFNAVVVVTDRDQRLLGISNDACWEKMMNACADKIISDALVFAKKRTSTCDPLPSNMRIIGPALSIDEVESISKGM